MLHQAAHTWHPGACMPVPVHLQHTHARTHARALQRCALPVSVHLPAVAACQPSAQRQQMHFAHIMITTASNIWAPHQAWRCLPGRSSLVAMFLARTPKSENGATVTSPVCSMAAVTEMWWPRRRVCVCFMVCGRRLTNIFEMHAHARRVFSHRKDINSIDIHAAI